MDNGEATDDGLQDTYDQALFQLVMTGFKPGDVPAMVQRAYLGDEAMPDWETSPSLTPTLYTDAHTWELTAYGRGDDFHYARRRSDDGMERHPDGQPCACPNAAVYAPPAQQQAAVLIPVRHTAIPAWRMALIQVLAAWITRLS